MREGYEGVVYDLDGTLVRLAVDWAAVGADVEAVYREAGRDPDGRDLWELLVDADDHPDLADRVERTIADHERAGGRAATRLPTADELARIERPAAVCSLNCEDACRIALARHDLLECVECVVGRDTVGARKPDPAPLLAAVEGLSLSPSKVVFVGDSERDADTARRAGVDFEYVGEGPSGH